MMLTRSVDKNSYRFTDSYFSLLQTNCGFRKSLKKFLTYYQNDNMIIAERDIIKVIISNKANGGNGL